MKTDAPGQRPDYGKTAAFIEPDSVRRCVRIELFAALVSGELFHEQQQRTAIAKAAKMF